ncbi:MAG: hypothetical protein JWN52_5273 [Actinomycetia bacterium]|nr:hypothetical protein [Actinomycetes bacterium]
MPRWTRSGRHSRSWGMPSAEAVAVERPRSDQRSGPLGWSVRWAGAGSNRRPSAFQTWRSPWWRGTCRGRRCWACASGRQWWRTLSSALSSIRECSCGLSAQGIQRLLSCPRQRFCDDVAPMGVRPTPTVRLGTTRRRTRWDVCGPNGGARPCTARPPDGPVLSGRCLSGVWARRR